MLGIVFVCNALVAATYLNVPSKDYPTINSALAKAQVADTVILDDGVYHERILIDAGLCVMARNPHKAIIDGGGRGTVVAMNDDSRLLSVVVKNGTIGVFTRARNVFISDCYILNNYMTGIMFVRQMPTIVENVIAFNAGSGIQTWDVKGSGESLHHNTIAYNQNHGISLGGQSTFKIEYNIIAFNKNMAIKTWGNSGKVEIVNNNFYDNLMQDLPANNASYDPVFKSPRIHLNFRVTSKDACKNCDSDKGYGVQSLLPGSF